LKLIFELMFTSNDRMLAKHVLSRGKRFSVLHSEFGHFKQCAMIKRLTDESTTSEGLRALNRERVQEILEIQDKILRLMREIGHGFWTQQSGRLFNERFRLAIMHHSTLHIAKDCAAELLRMWEHAIGGSNVEPAEITDAKLMTQNPQHFK
jgi:hypothetical protein